MKRRAKQKAALACAAISLVWLCGCAPAVPPDDPLYPSQQALAQANIEEAWRAGLTGRGVTIGVIDSGVSPHEDLDAGRIRGKSYVDGDPENYADTRGHGTLIAGLLAARRDNAAGAAGMTDSRLRVYKVAGEQPHIGADHVAQAIRDAADDGCDVVNLSLGTPNDSAAIRAAVEYALEKGVILVAAAGGGSDTPYYPAPSEGVMGVAAADALGQPVETGNAGVDLLAPGEGHVGPAPDGGYELQASGASCAAAMVTAMAAFARQEQPDLDAAGFLELLKQSVRGGQVADFELLALALGKDAG